MQSREHRIQHFLTDPEVSVLIIGAGINGIGVFWDLALQGVDVLLVDRADYSSGASAASSHMAHGGIRYLENGEFRLVGEAVRERNRLIENAPHLVKPLPTTFPIYKWFSGLFNAPLKFLGMLDWPAERGAVVIKIGMLLYDFYTREQGTVPRHLFMGRDSSLERFPALNPEIIFTGTYFDGAIRSPERIAIELVTDAVAVNHRAVPLNYVSIIGVVGDRFQLWDEVTGQTFGVQPKVVINAAGPWIDQVNQMIGHKTSYIWGTKGSHLVLDHPELRQAIGEHEFFFENEDGRIVLIFPLEDRVLVGTSDIRIDDPDEARITNEEVQYFLDMIKRVFPGIVIEPSHIVFTYSGVRPLERSEASSTGQISRDHTIGELENDDRLAVPVLSIIGGKWTTFRALAEQTADQVLSRLGRSRAVSTREIAVGGGKGFPRTQEDRERWMSRISVESGVDGGRIMQLFHRYGTQAESMAHAMAAEEDQGLKHYPTYSLKEIENILQREDVLHLDDFLFRRSMIGILGRSSKGGIQELAHTIGGLRGWSDQRIEEEILRTIDILRSKHRMDFNRYIGDS